MTEGRRRVVVLGHDAGRTGAPLLLLGLLRWACRHEPVEIEVLLRRGGPLVGSFADLGRVRCLRPHDRRGAADLIEGLIAETAGGRRAERVPALEARRFGPVRSRPGDLVIVNGVGGAALLDLIPVGPRVALLLHELDVGVRRSAGDEQLGRLWARVDTIVAVSEATALAVRARPGVDAGRVVVAHGFVDEAPAPAESPADARAALGMPDPGRPLVGTIGAGHWRKGIDLFVRLAARLVGDPATSPRLAWVGAVDPETEARVRHDLREAGLDDDVTMVGAVDDAALWYGAFDVVVSTAREDPFPLLGLEAGRAARPVVTFDNGGLRELLTDGCGVVVPPLDIPAMHRAVRALLDDPGRAERMGKRLRGRVLERHTTEVAAPAMWRALADAEPSTPS